MIAAAPRVGYTIMHMAQMVKCRWRGRARVHRLETTDRDLAINVKGFHAEKQIVGLLLPLYRLSGAIYQDAKACRRFETP